MKDITRPTIKPGEYRHYKGGLYRVLGVAVHSESLEPLVVYQAREGDYGRWVRPHPMFISKVEVDGKNVRRFTYVEEK